MDNGLVELKGLKLELLMASGMALKMELMKVGWTAHSKVLLSEVC